MHVFNIKERRMTRTNVESRLMVFESQALRRRRHRDWDAMPYALTGCGLRLGQHELLDLLKPPHAGRCLTVVADAHALCRSALRNRCGVNPGSHRLLGAVEGWAAVAQQGWAETRKVQWQSLGSSISPRVSGHVRGG